MRDTTAGPPVTRAEGNGAASARPLLTEDKTPGRRGGTRTRGGASGACLSLDRPGWQTRRSSLFSRVSPRILFVLQSYRAIVCSTYFNSASTSFSTVPAHQSMATTKNNGRYSITGASRELGVRPHRLTRWLAAWHACCRSDEGGGAEWPPAIDDSLLQVIREAMQHLQSQEAGLFSRGDALRHVLSHSRPEGGLRATGSSA